MVDIPVMLPPGFRKLCTKPLPTGSAEIVTIGITVVAFRAAITEGVELATIKSTFSATNSTAISASLT